MSKICSFFILIILSISSVMAKEAAPINDKPDSYYLEQFRKMFKRVEADYIQVPNKQELVDKAINGMLQSLDPYSTYYTDEDLELFIASADGEFGGIGIELIFDKGAIKVITPIDDMPAFKAGIQSGDYIVGVNGQLVSNLGFNKSLHELRGEAGSKVNLLVVGNEDNTIREVELERAIIKTQPIKYEIERGGFGNIAYVRIVAFNAKVTKDLKDAVKKIVAELKSKKQNLDGIILDMRNNPGGLFDPALAVSEYFIDQGEIVTVQGREESNRQVYSAGKFVEKAPNVPMIVLINGGSASSSEIVAGALQDHKRAIIMGTTSFGKGIVQVFNQVSDRAAVKLTTAKYLTPNGRSINAKGIVPDVYIENAKVEHADSSKESSIFNNVSIKSYLEKYNTDNDQEKKLDNSEELSQKYKNDYQYARAVDLMKGLIVSRCKKN